MAMLAGFFGVIAGLVAIVGIYGMVAYAVERRRRELGVRTALGAERWQLVTMVMRQAGTLVVVGLAVGTVLSVVGGRVVKTMLFEYLVAEWIPGHWAGWCHPGGERPPGELRAGAARGAHRSSGGAAAGVTCVTFRGSGRPIKTEGSS